jgi:hypothetical protein
VESTQALNHTAQQLFQRSVKRQWTRPLSNHWEFLWCEQREEKSPEVRKEDSCHKKKKKKKKEEEEVEEEEGEEKKKKKKKQKKKKISKEAICKERFVFMYSVVVFVQIQVAYDLVL